MVFNQLDKIDQEVATAIAEIMRTKEVSADKIRSLVSVADELVNGSDQDSSEVAESAQTEESQTEEVETPVEETEEGNTEDVETTETEEVADTLSNTTPEVAGESAGTPQE